MHCRWGQFTVLEPEVICMGDLWQFKAWKYFINLTGQEFPLRTNFELVAILKAFNGANSLEGTRKRSGIVSCLSFCLSFFLSVLLSVCLSFFLSSCLFSSFFLLLSFFLPFCLSFCIYFRIYIRKLFFFLSSLPPPPLRPGFRLT